MTIYTDGAARGNPGKSASGFMAYDPSDGLVGKYAEYNGRATNNFAEYRAIELALDWCSRLGGAQDTDVVLYSDNELVVRQLNGKYRIRSESMAAINRRVSRLMEAFRSIELRNVRRENIYIKATDRMLNQLLDDIEAREKTG